MAGILRPSCAPLALRGALPGLIAALLGVIGWAADAGSLESDGLLMLQRARQAGESLDYSGIYVHQRGPEVRSVRIAHRHAPGGTIEKRESLDGIPSETVRHGDRQQTYLPKQRKIVRHGREPLPAFPALHGLSAEQLVLHYRLRITGSERVAGRQTDAWVLEPRDGWRYGYRFWADQSNGLLLRVQTISERAEVIEQAAFNQIAFRTPSPSSLRASVPHTRGWRIEDAGDNPVVVPGWQIRWMPNGFVHRGSWTRSLGSEGAGSRAESRREVIQILYTDGLAGLSIFIEPWSAERSAQPLRLGALNMVGKRHGKFWLTIVGEVPMVAIRQVAEAIEFKENAPK